MKDGSPISLFKYNALEIKSKDSLDLTNVIFYKTLAYIKGSTWILLKTIPYTLESECFVIVSKEIFLILKFETDVMLIKSNLVLIFLKDISVI